VKTRQVSYPFVDLVWRGPVGSVGCL
jgi:hypothetical protein